MVHSATRFLAGLVPGLVPGLVLGLVLGLASLHLPYVGFGCCLGLHRFRDLTLQPGPPRSTLV